MKTLTLNAQQMLTLWKSRLGYAPLRSDCSMERVDGYDLDGMLLEKIRSWYVGALRSEPADALPLTDISAETAAGRKVTADGVVRLTLPADCLRVVEVDCGCWDRPALMVTDSGSPEALAQTNPFARSGSARPVAVVCGSSLHIYSVTSEADAADITVKAVMLPDADTFVLTPALMAAMPLCHD